MNGCRSFYFSTNFIILLLGKEARKICEAFFNVSAVNFYCLFFVVRSVGELEFVAVNNKKHQVLNNPLTKDFQLSMKKISLIFSLMVAVISNAFSSSPGKQVELMVQDSATGLAALAGITFVDGTSPMYIASEDRAFVLQSPDNAPQVYSFSQDNVACSSNSFGSFLSTSVVRLGLVVSDSSSFTFSEQMYTNFDNASMIFLEDRQLNVITDLRQSPYKVFIPAGQTNNRFFLHVTFPPALTTSPAGCLNNDGIIVIRQDSSIVWSACKVFDSTSTMVAIDTNITGNFSFTGLPGGNYRVEFDYANYTPSQSVFVEEHQLMAGLNVSNNHDFVLQNIQFFTAASNATQISWDFGDGSTITGIANPTYFYIYPGVYTARVNCANNFGCTVQADTLMYIDVASAINSIDGNVVKVITDNNTIRIEIDNASASEYNYVVYDLEGQAIKAGAITSGNMLVDMNNRSSGAYVVNLRSSTASLSQKVLITH